MSRRKKMTKGEAATLQRWATSYRERAVMGVWWDLLLAVEGTLLELRGGRRLGREKLHLLFRYGWLCHDVRWPLVMAVRQAHTELAWRRSRA